MGLHPNFINFLRIRLEETSSVVILVEYEVILLQRH
jgi:hypothetical protein